MAREGGGDVHLQGESGGGRVEPGADDADDAGVLQPADPVQGRRGGQSDQAGEFYVRAVCVGLQGGQELHVNFIKLNGHITKYYLVSAPRQPISCGWRRRWF